MRNDLIKFNATFKESNFILKTFTYNVKRNVKQVTQQCPSRVTHLRIIFTNRDSDESSLKFNSHETF